MELNILVDLCMYFDYRLLEAYVFPENNSKLSNY